MKVLIGTKNPGKIRGAKEALERYFDDIDIQGIPVSSNMNEEPVNNEIYLRAKNRINFLINYAKENKLNIDYFLAIESGITNLLGKWTITNIAVIEDRSGYESFGTSPSFPVPDKYINEIINTDFGQVMDKLFNESDLHSNKGGINFLTHNEISKVDLTRGAFTMALTQFINGSIWKD